MTILQQKALNQQQQQRFKGPITIKAMNQLEKCFYETNKKNERDRYSKKECSSSETQIS